MSTNTIGGSMTDHTDIVERLTGRTLVVHGGVRGAQYGWNMTVEDSAMHRDAAAEITRLRAEAEALRKALQGLLYEDGGSLAMSKDNPLCVAARAAIAATKEQQA
jgi:hypothetical protein